MSKGWEANPPNATWRKTRLFVLSRDNWKCQIRGPKCTVRATCVDHIDGRGNSESPDRLRASCGACNARYRPPRDPEPKPRTSW